ncbi:hypothetical protein SCHPADRAFT_899414 [Schizopora paradoxa]|uniref:Uncharacterized protein n=1 Tax=Schizopora paradoxa TaxID=27342 RepID=A0A0H2S424_9AGAM|nr:hypothetical protein SCHPADRAFT_899414 [Schizopora paradoxa]
MLEETANDVPVLALLITGGALTVSMAIMFARASSGNRVDSIAHGVDARTSNIQGNMDSDNPFPDNNLQNDPSVSPEGIVTGERSGDGTLTDEPRIVSFNANFRLARMRRHLANDAFDVDPVPAFTVVVPPSDIAAGTDGQLSERHRAILTEEILSRLSEEEDDIAERNWVLHEAQNNGAGMGEPSPPVTPSITDGDLPSSGLPSCDSIAGTFRARTYADDLYDLPATIIPRGVSVARWYALRLEEIEDMEAMWVWLLREAEAEPEDDDGLRAWALSFPQGEIPYGPYGGAKK